MSNIENKTVKKVLGKSKYANSKSKVKKQKKLIKLKDEDQKIKKEKDRQLKVKIKHLQKELERIRQKANNDSKSNREMLIIEEKIAKINAKQKVFSKKYLAKKE